MIAHIFFIGVFLSMATAEDSPLKSLSVGCQKLTGVSKLPLVETDVCDPSPRDVCGIFSLGSTCHKTSLDVIPLKSVNATDNFLVNCLASKCPATGPKGVAGVLKCDQDEKNLASCECPEKNKAGKFSCSICGSPGITACFCCDSME